MKKKYSRHVPKFGVSSSSLWRSSVHKSLSFVDVFGQLFSQVCDPCGAGERQSGGRWKVQSQSRSPAQGLLWHTHTKKKCIFWVTSQMEIMRASIMCRFHAHTHFETRSDKWSIIQWTENYFISFLYFFRKSLLTNANNRMSFIDCFVGESCVHQGILCADSILAGYAIVIIFE